MASKQARLAPSSAQGRSMNAPTSQQPTYVMRCMELRGGNEAVEAALSTPGLEVWVSSRPYGEHPGGGDVHYVSLCGGGEITRLIVADVSGHGEAVAETSAALRVFMRR